MDNNTPQPQPAGSGPSVSHKKRYVIIVIVAGVVAMIGFVVWLMIAKNNNTATQAPSKTTQTVKALAACSDDLIRQASVPLKSSDQIGLGQLVDKITALKDYDRDPNCLYIVLQYAIASGSATASSDYLSKLEKVYNPAVGFSKAFTVSVIQITVIRQSVAFLVQNAKQAQEDAKKANDTTAQGSEEADKRHAGKQ